MWRAVVKKEGIKRYSGLFRKDQEELAAHVRDMYALALHGEYARLNFPERFRIPLDFDE